LFRSDNHFDGTSFAPERECVLKPQRLGVRVLEELQGAFIGPDTCNQSEILNELAEFLFCVWRIFCAVIETELQRWSSKLPAIKSNSCACIEAHRIV